MIGWALRVLLVLAVALVAGVLTIPLGAVLERSGARAAGLAWSQAQGTLLHGRIANLAYGPQDLGNAELRLQPLALLSGQLRYNIDLTGTARGDMDVALVPGALIVDDANLGLEIARLVGLNDAIRAAGGVARLRSARFRIEPAGCTAGAGEIWTDSLVVLGNRYARELPELQGGLDCADRMLVLDLSGESGTATAVSIDGQFGLARPSRLEARVGGVDGEIAAVLSTLGFSVEDGEYVYVREVVVTGGSR